MFVAVEFGLVAVDRNHIDQLADDGDRGARVARQLLRHLPFALGGAQLGISIVSLIIGFLAEPVIAELIRPLLEPALGTAAANGLSIFLALALATIAQMVLGELIPKGLTIAHPEVAARRLSRPLWLFATTFKPVIWVLNAVANRIVRALGIEPQEELSHVRSLPELSLVFQASAAEGTLAGTASALLNRSVRFAEKTVADVLVPRVEVRALERDAPVTELVQLATTTGHSRFPVYDADLDDICGVVHVKAVHTLKPSERERTAVSALMSDVVAVPETRELEDVLFDMRRARQHLVIAIDEYGGTAGILTLEDVLEEIVGEIDDEYDLLTTRLPVDDGSGSYRLSGALHLDEVEETVGLVVPEGEYETLAGFVLDRFGRIPAVGDRFTFLDWELEVCELDRRRIAAVRLTPPETPPVRPDDGGGDA